MREQSVLAFDFGASSGRAILCSYDAEKQKIKLREVHRFPNEPVQIGGHFYWDILRLWHEIKNGLRKAWTVGKFESVAVDTWGVDYGLLDDEGSLMGNSFHYRDGRTTKMMRLAQSKLSFAELYAHTGNQIMAINTAFQLLDDREHGRLDRAKYMLPTPDLFAYFLTGDISVEQSIASTTQLFNPECGQWCGEVIEKLDLPEHIFPPMMETGAVKGMLSESLCKELGIESVPVIAVCGHDTQCAAFSVPCVDDVPFAFLSCGTWSLFGAEIDKPILTDQARECNLTNEVGYGGTITFLKNITGLWLLQETRRNLDRKGEHVSFATLEKLAQGAEGGVRFFDTDAPAFSEPGDMLERIRAWCCESNQPPPDTLGEGLRCIYDSLACKYREALEDIETCTGQRIERIYILGGGVKDHFLCQLTADICGIPVYTGAEEATAYGNAAMQLLACGILIDEKTAKQSIANSVTVKVYEPTMDHSDVYTSYCQVFKQK